MPSAAGRSIASLNNVVIICLSTFFLWLHIANRVLYSACSINNTVARRPKDNTYAENTLRKYGIYIAIGTEALHLIDFDISADCGSYLFNSRVHFDHNEITFSFSNREIETPDFYTGTLLTRIYQHASILLPTHYIQET